MPENKQHQELTVAQLAQVLNKLVEQGRGSDRVTIPYHPGYTTVGASPAAGILAAHQGIDWDAGTVRLQPAIQFGPGGEQLAGLRKSVDGAARMLFELRQILDPCTVDAETRVRQAQDLVRNYRKRS